ncbi:MAG: neutral/alkaline non-lysosomal ceramidase N-terminal domain-containing protein [Planctomycetota bacterium]
MAQTRSRGEGDPTRPEPHRLSPLALGFCAIALLWFPVGCRTHAGPFELQSTSGAEAAYAPLTAGVARVDFTPATGYALGGYGGGARRASFPLWFGVGWPGRLGLDARQVWYGDDPDGPRADMLVPAKGVHDPLLARALVLQAGSEPPVALVRIDAIAGSDLLTDRVFEEVQALGFRREGVIIAATHTHSGVGAYLKSRAAKLAGTDNFRQEIFDRIADSCVAAIRLAYENRRPASVGFGHAYDRGPDGEPQVAINRRAAYIDDVEPNDLDPEVALLRVVDRSTGRLMCLLVNFAVHPTVLGTRNHSFSADLAGAIEHAFEWQLAGKGLFGPDRHPAVLFFNGAEGDIGPRETSQGRFSCAELGHALAKSVIPAIDGIPLHNEVRLQAAYGERDLGDAFTFVAAGSRWSFYKADQCLPARLAAAPFTVMLNGMLFTFGFDNVRLAAYPAPFPTAGAYVNLNSYSRSNRYRFHALSLTARSGETACFATMPGEAVHVVGERVKAEAAKRGADQTFFLGLANGALGYLADEDTYFQGGYEAMTTLYGPEAAGHAQDAVYRCFDAIGLIDPNAPAP